MYIILNEMNFNEIVNKFDGFYNDINIIKIKIINEFFFFNLNSDIIFLKIILK